MADPIPKVHLAAVDPARPDDALFRALFRSEHGYVWHSLRRLGVPERDLEDVTHDVFVAVHRKLALYDRTRPARPWLMAFAVRAAADYRRLARNQRERLETGPEARDPAPSAERRLETADAQRLVIAALQGVEESRRAVFVMADLDELPVPEIARALEIPLNTAYSRLRIAREEFAAAVKRIGRARGAS